LYIMVQASAGLLKMFSTMCVRLDSNIACYFAANLERCEISWQLPCSSRGCLQLS
jgi:hypothetical protein